MKSYTGLALIRTATRSMTSTEIVPLGTGEP
jgi:hypothetical protein